MSGKWEMLDMFSADNMVQIDQINIGQYSIKRI